jgi:hypothetical protein
VALLRFAARLTERTGARRCGSAWRFGIHATSAASSRLGLRLGLAAASARSSAISVRSSLNSDFRLTARRATASVEAW